MDVFGDSSLFDEFEADREKGSTHLDICPSSIPRRNLQTPENGTNSSQEQHDSTLNTNRKLKIGERENESRGSRSTYNSDNSTSNNLQNVLKLRQENQELSKYKRLLNATRWGADDDTSPLVQVLYLNNPIARKYKVQIENYIHDLVANDNGDNMEMITPPLSSVCIHDKVEGKLIHGNKQQVRRKHMVIGNCQYYYKFILDPMGTPLVGGDNCQMTDGWETPAYVQIFLEALPLDPEEEALKVKKKENRPKNECWNCGGDHMLTDCQEPRNQKEISRRRAIFMANQGGPVQSLTGKNSKGNFETDPRFASFKPGEISENLRGALGLRDIEVPPWIYQMRMMGYPPGWLKEAECQTSGISMFDKHGKETNEDGELGEEGEVAVVERKVSYDTAKLVSFPGYNVPLPQGQLDEHMKFHMPPMSQQQSKDVLALYLAPKGGPTKPRPVVNRKRKRPVKDGASLGTLEEMDVDTDTTGTESDLEGPSPAKLKKLPRNPSELSSRSSSPNAEELEEQRQLLLAQLQDAESDSKGIELVVKDSVGDDSFIPPLPPTPTAPPLPSDSEPESDTGTPVRFRSKSGMRTPQGQNTQNSFSSTPSSSISVDFGTPIEKEQLEKLLPDSDNWKVGIIDHIPYENLPNATGTFQKMRGLLEKVRETVKEIEDSNE
ncbi:unnamed protein product [Owenia fusiformis]|uniref:Uncharacterized protein n=1 Tax=Owenia fusiformis TaxID=6347 RepID=A0A8J1TKJ8_OWEFU|nr:unnamed protein product [Owenia fusiformis]